MHYESLYHKHTPAIDPSVRGIIKLIITEKEDGCWYSELEPNILAVQPRDIYKLALLCASIQDHIQKNMTFMDTIIKTNEEVRKIHNELVEEKGGKNQTHKAWQKAMPKGKVTPDTVKYQTQLPLKEKKNDS